MTTKFKKSFSPMLICWNDIKIHLGFEDSYLVPPPTTRSHFCPTALSRALIHVKKESTEPILFHSSKVKVNHMA